MRCFGLSQVNGSNENYIKNNNITIHSSLCTHLVVTHNVMRSIPKARKNNQEQLYEVLPYTRKERVKIMKEKQKSIKNWGASLGKKYTRVGY